MTPTVEELMAQVSALSAQVSSLSRDNERLAEDNRRLSDGIAEAERESARLKGDLDRLIEQIKLMNTRFFGSRSERVVPDQLSLFNDIEASADPAAPEPRLEEKLRPVRRRGGKRRLDLGSMETVVIEHEIPEADRACPACGEQMAEMKVAGTRLVRLVYGHMRRRLLEHDIIHCTVVELPAEGHHDGRGLRQASSRNARRAHHGHRSRGLRRRLTSTARRGLHGCRRKLGEVYTLNVEVLTLTE